MIWMLWKKTGWIFFQLNSITSQKGKCQVYFCIKSFLVVIQMKFKIIFQGREKQLSQNFTIQIQLLRKTTQKNQRAVMRSWKLKRSLESFYLNKILWNYITSMQDFYDGSKKKQLMMLKPSLTKNFFWDSTGTKTSGFCTATLHTKLFKVFCLCAV